MLSEADQALVAVIEGMGLTHEQLNKLGNTPGWTHLGIAAPLARPHLYITILLSREKEPRDLYTQILTLTPRISTLVGALCVMEFDPHSHVHILCDRPPGLRKSNLIRSITRALQLPRAECVDILMSNKAIDYHNRLQYTLGNKSDDSKATRVLADRQIREEHEIPHHFTL